jgi:hypothetical protein
VHNHDDETISTEVNSDGKIQHTVTERLDFSGMKGGEPLEPPGKKGKRGHTRMASN